MHCRCGFCGDGQIQGVKQTRIYLIFFRFQNNVLHKRVLRGRRCGTSDAHQLYFKAHDSLREAQKMDTNPYWKDQLSCEHKASQTKIGWTEETCDHLDKIEAQDHSCTATQEERRRYACWGVPPLGCDRMQREQAKVAHTPRSQTDVTARPLPCGQFRQSQLPRKLRVRCSLCISLATRLFEEIRVFQSCACGQAPVWCCRALAPVRKCTHQQVLMDHVWNLS